jgi:hypothetical protein
VIDTLPPLLFDVFHPSAITITSTIIVYAFKVLKVLYPKVLEELSESPKLSSMEVRKSLEDVNHSTRFSVRSMPLKKNKNIFKKVLF